MERGGEGTRGDERGREGTSRLMGQGRDDGKAEGKVEIQGQRGDWDKCSDRHRHSSGHRRRVTIRVRVRDIRRVPVQAVVRGTFSALKPCYW